MVSIGAVQKRVARVHAHRVDVLDEADGDHVTGGVANDLELELLPAEHRLLDEDLADPARLQSACRDGTQVLDVVDEPAAGAAHRVGRTDDHRVPEPCGDLLGSLDGRDRGREGHLDPETVHRLLEGETVLARSIASGFTPMMRTPCSARMPALLRAPSERLRPVWPPRLGRSASGFSAAMISVRISMLSGSM
jgi:hypothetical protein